MTIMACSVALNISYVGLLLMVEKVASAKKYTQFKTRVQNLYLIYDLIYDPKV